MLKFALVASGSKGNCCIIKNEQTSIVIDCGSTKTHLSQSFSQLQYDHQTCDALFITHSHSDHISQLKMFDNIATYAKCELDTPRFTKLASLSKTRIGNMNIHEIPLSHDAENTSGFIIEDEHSKIVYITDTGYIKEEYYPLLQGADYYIFESNHDIEMLMATRRPMYVKQRIIGDVGHLCNEDSAYVLNQLVTSKTKEIVLAHLSEEGNSKQKAYAVLKEQLKNNEVVSDTLRIVCASQFGTVRNKL